MKVGFIGTGNMGGALLSGYLEGSRPLPQDVLVYDADPLKTAGWQEQNRATAARGIGDLIRQSEVVFIGVKPGAFGEVLPAAARAWAEEKILVSMAAGIRIEIIESFLPAGSKIVRIMPNTPARVREAMIAVCRSGSVEDGEFDRVMGILNSAGRAREVKEEQIHCVIGVSGSSPAYTYMYIEALADAAVRNGMDRETAVVFAAQSVLGAAKMVLETGTAPSRLRDDVCSPGGTTIEAVNRLRENGFAEKIAEGFQAAVDKSEKMEAEAKGKKGDRQG